MKARVKETGEFIEVIPSIYDKDSYDGNDGYTYTKESLIMLNDKPDYWEKLKHQYAGLAMQGLVMNPKLCEIETSISIASTATTIASALIDKLKEESQCEK